MEENTTTEKQVVDTGAEQALPETQPSDTADNSTQEVSTTSDEGVQSTLPEEDDNKLASFAKGQGIEDLSELSDRERKLLKVAYDNNAEFQRNRQKATQLEKTMTQLSDEAVDQYGESTGQDVEVVKRLQRMEVKESIRDFWESNPEAKKYEKEMAKIAMESGLAGSPEAILQASYAIAVSRDTNAVKSQAKRETLETLAQKQQASVPTGNATTAVSVSNAITPENVNQMVSTMSLSEYKKRLPEINKALSQR